MTKCVEWHRSRNSRGYGGVWHEGVWCKAHRVAYCKANGLALSDIDGQVVMHTCDNPPCVNPAHLVLGTQLDNIADRHLKGRTSRGAAKSNAKMCEVTAWYVKARYAKGGKTIADLAREFGVDRSVISRIVAGHAWSHI